jgi:hypothetical protein
MFYFAKVLGKVSGYCYGKVWPKCFTSVQCFTFTVITDLPPLKSLPILPKQYFLQKWTGIQVPGIQKSVEPGDSEYVVVISILVIGMQGSRSLQNQGSRAFLCRIGTGNTSSCLNQGQTKRLEGLIVGDFAFARRECSSLHVSLKMSTTPKQPTLRGS